MNRFHVSARLRAAAKSAFLIVALSTVSAYVSGCDDSTPACPPSSPGCMGPVSTTPFTAGSLPGSFKDLGGDRCAASTSTLTLQGNGLLAVKVSDTSTMTTSFAVNEPFIVYWSICNVGSMSLPAVATMQGAHIKQTSGSGGPNDTTSWSIPALDSCKCMDPLPTRQFPSGVPVAGTYEVNLIGQFNDTPPLSFTVN